MILNYIDAVDVKQQNLTSSHMLFVYMCELRKCRLSVYRFVLILDIVQSIAFVTQHSHSRCVSDSLLNAVFIYHSPQGCVTID